MLSLPTCAPFVAILPSFRVSRWLPERLRRICRLSDRSIDGWLPRGSWRAMVVSAISSPKLPRDLPGVLTTQQVEALLKTPDTSTPAGLRDAAMLELLYASGARISELAALNVESIVWSERTLRLWGKGSKERIVPLYRRALEATRLYIEEGRPELLAQAKRRDPLPGRIRCLYRRAVIA